MISFRRYALIVAVTLALAGCRQADGPLPVADQEVQNRLDDLSHDLMNVAAGQSDATTDFANDLRVFADTPQGAEGALQFGRRLAAVVPGTRLSDQTAGQLARSCWTAVAARQMSGRQVEALQSDIENVLISIGVTESNARAAAAEVETVQQVVTSRAKRWYEFY